MIEKCEEHEQALKTFTNYNLFYSLVLTPRYSYFGKKNHLFDLFQNSKTFCFVFRIDKIQANNLINWPIKILMQKMQISKCIKTILIYLLFSSKTKELTLFNIENVLWVKLSWISETDSVFIFKGPYETDSPSDGHHTPVSLKK